MELNTSKTKEMLLGRIDSTSIPLLSTAAGPIQRVTKLLGLHLDASLSWPTHHYIPLYLKLANVCIFLSNWREHHTNYYIFTQQQSAQFLSMLPQFGESVARKLSSWNQYKKEQYIIIIFNSTLGMSCPNLLFIANINSLKTGEMNFTDFSSKKCVGLANPTSCLHHLLPHRRNTSVTSRLRSTTPLPHPTSRTK